MNNETNRGEETHPIGDRFFDWLLAPTDDVASLDDVDDVAAIDPEMRDLPELPSADLTASESATAGAPPVGEIPVVQTRFNALIERRLRVEIEQNLPLFPWETHVLDYEPERAAEPAAESAVELAWLQRLRQIELPIRLPDRILASIFTRCQTLAQELLPEGVQLLRAIEPLFPQADHWLHELTGTFLQEATVRDDSELKARLMYLARAPQTPPSFDDASRAQQALLSMLVAREILQDLRLELTPNAPQLDRRWPLESGELAIAIQVTQTQTGNAIQVFCEAPCACSVGLFGTHSSALDRCDDRGTLRLVLPNASEQTYTLKVNTDLAQAAPLQFAVHVRS